MKNIIVTGCASGIGRYLFFNLDKKKYKVIGVDKEICNGGYVFKVDISDYNLLEKKLSALKDCRIDAIVNIAGVCIRKPFYKFTDLEFDNLTNCNVKSVFNMCKLFYSNLIKSKGCIVNVSSVHSKATLQDYSMYAMTKGAVESFTRGLAVELSQYGVRVNCICLGAVDTSMLPYVQSEVDRIPLGHVVDKPSIFSMVEELINNRSMTGSIVTLDCGMLSKLSVEM